MNNNEKIEFEKSISRDWSVLFCELWQPSYTTELKKQYGWEHTDGLIEGKNNTVTVYHPPVERYVLLRDFIISKIFTDNQWLINIAKKLRSKVSSFFIWCAKNKEVDIERKTNKEILELIDDFSDKLREIGPAFFINLAFPFQMENHPEAAKYKQSINEAILTRGKVEKMAPIANDFSLFLGEEAIRRGKLKDKSLKKYLSFNEMKAIFSNQPVDEKKISQRKKYFLISRDGIGTENIEKFIARKGWILKKIKAGDVKAIKGTTACPGKASGRAKIVLSSVDFNKVENGDILISSMTTPEYMSVLKKVAAFLTDEGGITCHAAIVSREMKKPCIIGTKIATKILKDGDLVEVDADKGVVRVIK